MLVQRPSNICTHRWSIPIDTFASVATGGNSNGCEKGVGEAVGVGVIEGVGVGVGVAVGEAVGVGLGIDVVYWIASAGGWRHVASLGVAGAPVPSSPDA